MKTRRFLLERQVGQPWLVVYATTPRKAVAIARSQGFDVVSTVEEPLYAEGTFGPEADTLNNVVTFGRPKT